jgi:hypothetical protein
VPFLGCVPAVVAIILAAAELERLRPRPDPSSDTGSSLGALMLAALFLTDEARARAQALRRAQAPNNPGRIIPIVALILAVLATFPPYLFCLNLVYYPCQTTSEVRNSAFLLLLALSGLA